MDLILTNGDVAGELLRHTTSGAEVFPWRDVLHGGPAPLTATLAELTEIRAAYLGGCGWGDRAEIAANLQARDRGRGRADSFDRVVLWFEHDLYDQLQLLQILDWFSRKEPRELLLVQASEFLGRQSEVEIEALRAEEQSVAAGQLTLAAEAWAAFRAPTPEPWHALLGRDLSPLPFLERAVRRMLEELPGRDGLSRTQPQILGAIAGGITTPPALFVVVHGPNAKFLALLPEASLRHPLFSSWCKEASRRLSWAIGASSGLALARVPLIQGLNGAPFQPGNASRLSSFFQSELALSAFGEAVLEGREDNIAMNGIDRWWGGTRLTGERSRRFDADEERLIAPV